MILETKNKKIKLVFRTRKIVDIANILKSKDFEDVFTKAYAVCDLDALSKIIYILAEDENKNNVFTSSEMVYDFLDDYRVENKATYVDVYKKIAEALNEEGFFKKKKTKKELEEMLSNPLSTMNMDELLKKSAENAMSKIAEKEFQEKQFQGYKA